MMNVVRLNSICLNGCALNDGKMNGHVGGVSDGWNAFITADNYSFVTADDLVFTVKG